MSGNGPGRPDDDQARWEAATQVCEERPSWAVIWLARKGAYRARPLFRAAGHGRYRCHPKLS